MPTVKIDAEYLWKELGREYCALHFKLSISESERLTSTTQRLATDEFRTLCFDFGIELEDDTSELEMASKEFAQDVNLEQKLRELKLSEKRLLVIDIPANRCVLDSLSVCRVPTASH